MEPAQVVTVVAVLAAWTVLALAIRQWGPGRARRRVKCPTRRVRAKVVAEQREGDFGSLRMVDVVACSLFPDRRPDCGKECLARL